MSAKSLPPQVTQYLYPLLGWLAWMVLLLCIARTIYLAGLLAIRLYREEAVEGFAGALLAAALIGSASGIAAALFPTH
ncbi:hypothetical protein GFY24_37005 [Nocardia sp. SYP-A9097]|uniref:hypothetical protein n=1 Tax=Nocardia sp. SYP-A9097 TaxID=2663237 RepID=UPI00129B66C5|nr:hypothetical protein [Nocardia sp. SYP-A9097]MRH92955.1 hypothetical protein [Nocardia sp. SYP-A9097]